MCSDPGRSEELDMKIEGYSRDGHGIDKADDKFMISSMWFFNRHAFLNNFSFNVKMGFGGS